MDFDKINIDSVSYNVKDTTARQQIGNETTARKQADSQLSQQIENVSTSVQEEANAREQADSQIIASIPKQIGAALSESAQFITPQQFGAKADGTTDDTAAINNALSAAQTGKIGVYFPSGQYVVSSFTVPAGVMIKGVATFQADRNVGTWILPNQTATPAITLNSGCVLSGFAFFYPGQVYNNGPVVYAASIQVQNESTRVMITDVLFYNSYDGINANNHHESLTITNVQGYCINTCVFAGDCSDVDRFTNIHTNVNMLTATGYANAQSYRTWTRANGVAFRFGQGDWPCFTDMFCWGYRHGFYLEPTNFRGSGYAGMAGCHFVKCGADGCGTAWVSVGISGQSYTNHWGLQFDDCFMVAMNADNPGNDTQFAVLLQACDDATFNNCRVWGTSVPAFNLQCAHALVNNCVFWEYGSLNPSTSVGAIEVHRGTVNVTNCVFRANNKPLAGIYVKEECNGLTVTNCTFVGFGGNSWMVNNAEGIVQLYVCDNVLVDCDNSKMFTGKTPTGFGVIDMNNVRHMINLTVQDGI